VARPAIELITYRTGGRAVGRLNQGGCHFRSCGSAGVITTAGGALLEELLHGHKQVAGTLSLSLSLQPGYTSGRKETNTKVEAGRHC
jgi:hypothetical protein